MSKTVRDLIIITISTLALTILIWLPHILKLPNFFGLNFTEGFNTIYRNYDGLNYIVIAKSFYDPNIIAGIPQALPANYFAAHFPGYPILIAIFAPFLGYLKSMLFIALLFTILSAIAFYFLVKDFKLTSYPLTLTLTFLILPARWIVVHSVGSPEPMFIFFAILAFYFFLKAQHLGLKIKYLLPSAIFTALTILTRPPGVLLGLALGLFVLWQAYQKKSFSFIFKFWPFLLLPLTLMSIFYLYSIQYGDFFAYFHSGDNIHLAFPPFSVFNKSQFWVGDIWLEDIVYIFILELLAGLLLIKQKLAPLGFFVLTFVTAAIFVAHRDISRYTIPIIPFVLIAFERVLTSKEFRIVLIILALGLYLYSQNYILNNFAPVADLSLYN